MEDDLKEIRRERLKALIMERFHGNQSALSRAVDSSPSYINRVLIGTKGLGEELARKFEARLDLPSFWLDGPAAPGVVAAPSQDTPGYTLVARHLIKLSAGNGNLAFEDEQAPPLAFRTDWLERNRLDPNRLVVAYVKGDSMQPTLQDGDTILINTADRSIVDGRIYALRHNGELRIKRLYLRTFSILIESDNLNFKPEEIPNDRAEELRIIGRVVWSAGSL